MGSQLHSQQVVKSRLQVCSVQLGPERSSGVRKTTLAFLYKAPLVSAAPSGERQTEEAAPVGGLSAAPSPTHTCLSNSFQTTTSDFSSLLGFSGKASDFFLTSGKDFK